MVGMTTQDHDQPPLPGMERRPPKEPEGIAPAPKELTEASRPNGEATPPRQGYDDTKKGYAGAPHAGTETSFRAAKKIAPALANIRNRIFDYVHGLGYVGATADEVSVALDMCITTVGPRFGELRERSRLVKTQDTRPTRRGRAARVHVAAEYSDQLVTYPR